jgi:hypothetical protein
MRNLVIDLALGMSLELFLTDSGILRPAGSGATS